MPCAAVHSRSDTYYTYRPSDEQLGFARKRLKVGENRRKMCEKSSDEEVIDAIRWKKIRIKPRFVELTSIVFVSEKK